MITSENKKAITIALKKVRGLSEKLEQMVEGDVYCLDIAQQVNAALGLLRGINRDLLRNHLQTCGQKCMVSKDEKKRNAFIDELMKVVHVSSHK